MNSLFTKFTYDVGKLGPGLGQAQKCGRVKPVNGRPYNVKVYGASKPKGL
jgi:hypothetical protein